MSEKLNSAIAVIGIDIGKNSFHLVGHDSRGAIVLRQKWSRGLSAPAISIFRGSIPHPMQLLCTLRNRCRQRPRNTHYQAGSPLLGPDLHRLDRTSFAAGAPILSILSKREIEC